MSLLARAFAVVFSPGMVTGPAAYMTKKQKQKRSKKSRKSAVAKELEKQDKKLLALRLKLRRPREELVSQGIMPPLKSSPGFHEQRQRLERAKVGDSLQRKIRLRPEKSHLVNQHILADTHVDPLVNATQQRLKRSRLEQDLDSKIKNRPGPLELIEGNILKTENMLVEQAVKDGKVKFLKTNSLDIGPYEFDEDSQEGFSDEALSPSQSDVSQAESQLSRGSLPSAQSSSAFADHSKTLQQQQQQLQQQQKQQQQRSSVSSPSQLLSPKAGQTFVTIKQEPGLISPPPITSNSFTPISAVSNITLSSGKVTPSPRQPRKKQTKRPKPKEIKFHEYKPPNEQSSKPQQASTVSNPYNLLLMQQQLYLQLQLLQQQQLILPNTANQKQNTASASSSNTSVTSTHTTSNPTATTTAAAGAAVPTAPVTPPVPVAVKQQPDVKPNIAALQGKPRGLSNLEDMKVSELKLELKNRGLHVSGTKPQLVERLRPHVEQQVTTSATSPNEVSTTTVTSSTRVSSSTDLDVPFSETASTVQGSLSTPPVSPEYRSSFSVTSEPMSPGSAFDPMSPPTFQNVLTTPVCSPDTVSTTNQQTMSGSGREGSPFDQTMPTLESPQPLPPASSILPVDILNSDNTTQDMMDVSSLDTNTAGSQISNDLLLQQQLKIQELERMLQLSQMQLQMQQLQQPNLSPLSLSQSSTQQHQQQQQSPAGKTTTLSPQQLQPEGKPSAFMFHSKDFAHTLNQQPKVFSFATPPPNGQPFLFSKQQSPDTQSIALPNGMVASKAASLPSSPTERNVLGIGSGMTRSVTQPTFANPPPNYEEAVRQSQGNTPVNGSPVGSPPKGNIANSDPRSTKCQDLDDLLEVLVDHGYQIPITPKFRDMQRTLHNSTGGLTTITHSVVRGRGGSIDLKLPVPGPSPPPPMTHSYPSTDLPMEVDPTDLNISSLDLGDTSGGGGMARGERTGRTLSAPFDIPMTTIDACETSMDTGKDVGASGSTNPDNDLNWLDLVIPSSASGLTPVSATPPTFNMDGAFGATLGKDPFPLNLLDLNDISTPTDLHHLEDDVWDNIPIAE
ncbi:myocardin-related transcription factor A-like isoform X2 [Patiria miniata]|uniref:SAP domain-containing protein n=1 Tax=Patiria miniata TaxID=46514 RepID=A0A914AHQ0_PATMI|nr:myocardin-related transcription factor A-like isoform X2 [Patiria miniata]